MNLIDVKNKNSTNINNFFYNEVYEQIFSNHFSILFPLKNEISFFLQQKKIIEKQTKNYPLFSKMVGSIPGNIGYSCT